MKIKFTQTDIDYLLNFMVDHKSAWYWSILNHYWDMNQDNLKTLDPIEMDPFELNQLKVSTKDWIAHFNNEILSLSLDGKLDERAYAFQSLLSLSDIRAAIKQGEKA